MHKYKLFFSFVFIITLSIFGLSACSKTDNEQPIALRGETMGTYWQVNLGETVSSNNLQALKSEINAKLIEINQSMSTYIGDSELMQFNHHRDSGIFPISSGLRTVIAKALEISVQSNGAYDVTVGPLVDAWGFGPENIIDAPSDQKIQSLLKNTGYQNLILDHQGLSKKIPSLSVDLSSIAKGYGVDQIAAVIENAGYFNYIVDIGGEIDVKGLKFGKQWKLGVEVPEDNRNDIESIIYVNKPQMSLATSGNYRNYADYAGGIHAVHTINPTTGYPEQSTLVSVTVISEDCMTADAYATTLMALGDQKAADFAEKYHLAAMFIYSQQASGEFVVKSSSTFKKLLGDQK